MTLPRRARILMLPTLFASVPGLQVIAFEFQQAFAGVGASRDGDVELT